MLEHGQPPNWVAERAKCRLALIFEALSQLVERDVAEFNKVAPRPATWPDKFCGKERRRHKSHSSGISPGRGRLRDPCDLKMSSEILDLFVHHLDQIAVVEKKRWQKELANQNFRAIYFNAWDWNAGGQSVTSVNSDLL